MHICLLGCDDLRRLRLGWVHYDGTSTTICSVSMASVAVQHYLKMQTTVAPPSGEADVYASSLAAPETMRILQSRRACDVDAHGRATAATNSDAGKSMPRDEG